MTDNYDSKSIPAPIPGAFLSKSRNIEEEGVNFEIESENQSEEDVKALIPPAEMFYRIKEALSRT